MTPSRPAFLALLPLLGICGCYQTYSPPARTIHTVSPGRIGARQAEIGTGANGFPTMGTVWDLHASVGMADWLVLDGTAALGALDDPALAMLSSGPRFQFVEVAPSGARLAVDFELGGGGGIGGELYGGDSCDSDPSDDEDDESWWPPPPCEPGYPHATEDEWAAAAYTGIGAGFRAGWFGMFVRGRYQVSKAVDIPHTHWISGVGGIEVLIARHVYITVTGGYAGWYTWDFGWYGYPLAEAGLSFVFGFPDPSSAPRRLPRRGRWGRPIPDPS
jgi:hypothetical protein